MFRLIATTALWAAILGAVWAPAQSMSPLISEYTNTARGTLTVSNASLLPLNVVLDVESFTVTAEGIANYRELDAHIHVRLSRTSMRLGPNQSQIVSYTATADRLPAWFTIYASFSDALKKDGLKVITQLPHTVYLLPNTPLQRDAIALVSAKFRGDGKIDCEIENRGEVLGRVKDVEVMSQEQKKSTYPGFPLFPGQRRHLQIDWKSDNAPQTLILNFPKFRVEGEIEASNVP